MYTFAQEAAVILLHRIYTFLYRILDLPCWFCLRKQRISRQSMQAEGLCSTYEISPHIQPMQNCQSSLIISTRGRYFVSLIDRQAISPTYRGRILPGSELSPLSRFMDWVKGGLRGSVRFVGDKRNTGHHQRLVTGVRLYEPLIQIHTFNNVLHYGFVPVVPAFQPNSVFQLQ